MTSQEDSERLVAGLDLVGRTGAKDAHLEHLKLEGRDDEPDVWIAAAWYPRPGGRVRMVAAANEAHRAAFRLLEQVVDGGECVHCGRPSGVDDSTDWMPLDKLVCWYQYDPELKTYRRGCEGGS